MALQMTPVHARIGVRITGVRLDDSLGDDDFAAIRAAFEDHSLLVFPGQHLSTAEQVAFSARFGPLEVAITRLGEDDVSRHVANLSNLDAHGELVPPDDRQQLFHRANQLWHTDSTYKPDWALASLLSARLVPTEGGETAFVSTRAAWDDMPAPRRAGLEPLWARHDLRHSRATVAPDLLTDTMQRTLPPTVRPLVRANPVHGRRGFYTASHAFEVLGLPADEGRALLDELMAHCTRPEQVYTHRWQPGDLVMWDNRATLHRGCDWDAAREARVMYRTTVIDTEPMEAPC